MTSHTADVNVTIKCKPRKAIYLLFSLEIKKEPLSTNERLPGGKINCYDTKFLKN